MAEQTGSLSVRAALKELRSLGQADVGDGQVSETGRERSLASQGSSLGDPSTSEQPDDVAETSPGPIDSDEDSESWNTGGAFHHPAAFQKQLSDAKTESWSAAVKYSLSIGGSVLLIVSGLVYHLHGDLKEDLSQLEETITQELQSLETTYGQVETRLDAIEAQRADTSREF